MFSNYCATGAMIRRLCELCTVAYSLIFGRILYALPAWGGFISAEFIRKMNEFFKRNDSWASVLTIDNLLAGSIDDLFHKTCRPIPGRWLYITSCLM